MLGDMAIYTCDRDIDFCHLVYEMFRPASGLMPFLNLIKLDEELYPFPWCNAHRKIKFCFTVLKQSARL